MKVQSYLYFDGRCEEAVDFYRRHLGAEITMNMRFSESPVPPGDNCQGEGHQPQADKIMHCSFRIGDTEIMASDGMCIGNPEFKGFALALMVADKNEAERMFAALADGGQVQMVLAETFFSPAFGMVSDRFGVLWNVVAEPPQN